MVPVTCPSAQWVHLSSCDFFLLSAIKWVRYKKWSNYNLSCLPASSPASPLVSAGFFQSVLERRNCVCYMTSPSCCGPVCGCRGNNGGHCCDILKAHGAVTMMHDGCRDVHDGRHGGYRDGCYGCYHDGFHDGFHDGCHDGYRDGYRDDCRGGCRDDCHGDQCCGDPQSPHIRWA